VAAKALGVSTHTIIALEEVSKPDVPEAVQAVADRGEVPITRLAEAIKDARAEKARAVREALASGSPLDFSSTPDDEPVQLDAKVIIEKATVRHVALTSSLQAGSTALGITTVTEPEIVPEPVKPPTPDLYAVLDGISKMLSVHAAGIRALPQKSRVRAVLIDIMKKAKAAIPVVPVSPTEEEDDYLDDLLN